MIDDSYKVDAIVKDKGNKEEEKSQVVPKRKTF